MSKASPKDRFNLTINEDIKTRLKPATNQKTHRLLRNWEASD